MAVRAVQIELFYCSSTLSNILSNTWGWVLDWCRKLLMTIGRSNLERTFVLSFNFITQ